MVDVATNFAHYGSIYASSKDTSKYLDKAGNVWNYVGPSKNSILSPSTKGTNVGTYNALKSGLADGSNGLYYGARFAYAMRQTGLDHPYNGDISIITKGARLVGGVITMALLAITFAANNLLNMAFAIFQWINPFTALKYLTTDSAIKGTSIWAPAMEVARPIYKQIGGSIFIFALLAFMLAFFLALTGHSIIDTGNGHHQLGRDTLGHSIGSAVWKLLRRILVFFAGPIVIATLAADFMDQMKDDTNVTDSVAYEQIYGHYVDFSDWVDHSRLALPAKSGSGNSNELDTYGNNDFSTNYILEINGDGAGNEIANRLASKQKTSTKDFSKTMSFLWSYISSATYNGTSWQDNVRSTFKQQAAKANDDGAVKNPISEFKFNAGKANNWNTGNNYTYYDADDKNASSIGEKINNNPYLTDYSLDYDKSKGYYTTNAPSYSSPATLGSASNAGLSTLGMYNYLNTYADGSGVYYTTPTSFLGINTINQHASIGFVGRGFLFLANYLLMNVIMLTSALVLAFAVIIVLEGAVSGIPRLLIYAIELASLRWEGFLSIIKELIKMYARLVLSIAIVSIFTDTVTQVFDKLEEMLVTGGKGIKPIFSTINLLPFQMNTTVLALIRLIESAVLLLLIFVMLKTWRDILQLIGRLMDKVFGKIGGSRGNPKLPGQKNASRNFGGKNTNPNDPRRDQDGNDNGKDDPNSYEAVKARRKDALQQDDAKNPSLLNSMKAGAALAGLSALDKLDNTKGGQMFKAGAKGVMSALGGSKLGRLMGFKGRGDAASKLQKVENLAKQGMASAADPMTVDNSAQATQTDKEHDNAVANENQERTDAAENATDEAAKLLDQEQTQQDQKDQAKNQLANDIKKDGTLKKGADAAETLKNTQKALNQIDATHGENVTGAKKQVDNVLGNFNKMAQQEAKQNQAEEQQADQEVTQADQNLDNAKAYEQHENQAVNNLEKQAKLGNKQAQQALPEARQKAKQATAVRKQAEKQAEKAHDHKDRLTIAKNSALRSQMENATGKGVGNHGENLRKLSNGERTRARRQAFTALTHQVAPTVNKQGQMIDEQGQDVTATPEIIQQAQEAKQDALQTLNDTNATKAEKQDAQNKLDDANVVLTTGVQYGQFTKQGVQPSFKQASAQQIKYSQSIAPQSIVAAQTGYFMKQQAPELNQMQKRANAKVAEAQQIVQTGRTASGNQASAQQITEAKQIVSQTNPTQAIQNRMINSTNSIIEAATNEATAQYMHDHPEQQTAPDISSPEMQERVMRVIQKPQYLSQLQDSGVVSQNAPKQTVINQIRNVQSLGESYTAALKASQAPIERQVNARGGFTTDIRQNHELTRKIIKSASVKQVNQMTARSNWVDAKHYGNTTYKDVVEVLTKLTDAEHSGNAKQISDAKIYARQRGIATSLINSASNRQHTLKEIQDVKTNVTQEALSRGLD